MNRFRLVVLAVLLQSALSDKYKETDITRTRLKGKLLFGYNKHVVPRNWDNSTVSVTVSMILKYFTFDTHESTLSVHSWLSMSWTDEKISWKPADYSDIDSLHISSDHIWHPDLSVYNGADLSGSQTVFSTVTCLVSFMGGISCVTPTRDDAICSPFLRRYPFDAQNCTIKYGSWVHSGEVLGFRMPEQPVKTEDFEGTGEWRLVQVVALKNVGNYSCCPNSTYPSLNYTFFLQRRSGMLVCIIIVPAIVMLVVCLACLCLSPEESSRLCLIGTNTIIHLIYIQYLSWQPINGPEPPLILLFARDSLLMCVFSLVLTVGQRRLTRARSKCPELMNKVLVGILNNPFGRYVFMFDEVHTFVSLEDTQKILEDTEATSDSVDWLKFSRILDRLSFVVYLVVYLSMLIVFVS